MSSVFKFSIDRNDRFNLNGHSSFVLWLTGYSGAGKSSLADELDIYFNLNKMHSCVLDGDNLRNGINKDLDYTNTGRDENIRRTAEIAKMMLDNGSIVICSLISPLESQRKLAKEIIGSENFIEIHIDCPIEVCIARDKKGLYKKAKENTIDNFTGISMKYEAPVAPDLKVNTTSGKMEEGTIAIVNYLKSKKYIK